jgi:hypothetical protein
MSDRHDIPWNELLGGNRIPYDPRPALARLRKDSSDAACAELWSIAKNLRTYARLLLELDESEAAELLAADPREGA